MNKKNSNTPPMKMFYSFPKFAIVAVPFFLLQYSHPTISYWVGSPSTYHLSKVYDDAQNIIKLKENNYSVESYIKARDSELNSTEIILLLAVSAADIIKMKKRDIASDDSQKRKKAFKYGTMLMKDLTRMQLLNNNTHLKFSNYSLIHWMSPFSLFEICILNLIESGVREKFGRVLFSKGNEVLVSLEKELSKLSDEDRSLYKAELKVLRKKLNDSANPRSIASQK